MNYLSSSPTPLSKTIRKKQLISCFFLSVPPKVYIDRRVFADVSHYSSQLRVVVFLLLETITAYSVVTVVETGIFCIRDGKKVLIFFTFLPGSTIIVLEVAKWNNDIIPTTNTRKAKRCMSKYRYYRKAGLDQMGCISLEKILQPLDSVPEFATVSIKIQAARNELGLSQEELAVELGMKRQFLAKLESGNHNPSLATLMKIANAFGKKLVVEFA
jgi:DNA-binding XRE family transcriptional regulator